LLTTVALQSAQAQTYTVIHKFSNGGDGATPEAGLTLDAGGNFYGTTGFGGYQSTGVCQADGGCGVVFRLSHHGTGWTITGLYQFLAGDDGDGPLSRVVFGPDGALYGTTQSGGGNGCTDGYGCGTVYRLTPPARLCTHFSCEWSETVLHAFTAGADGRLPYFGDLTFDTAGDIFGTTALGGIHNDGTLYKVSRQGEGWTSSSTAPETSTAQPAAAVPTTTAWSTSCSRSREVGLRTPCSLLPAALTAQVQEAD
jgi:uncharacterized repeat protein (TIGR03803 family)